MGWDEPYLANTQISEYISTLSCFQSLEQQWCCIEDRFQRFEESLWYSSDSRLFIQHPTPDNFEDDLLLSFFNGLTDLVPSLPSLDDENHHLQSAVNGDGVVTDRENVGHVIKNEVDDQFMAGAGSNGGDATIKSSKPPSEARCKSSGKKKADELQFDDVQKYFDRTITAASKELNIGLTLLKRRCRELGIQRWPHRKVRSLKSLITNAKEMGMESEIMMLEEQKKMLENRPELELSERAKRLRQKSFKVSHKRRKLAHFP